MAEALAGQRQYIPYLYRTITGECRICISSITYKSKNIDVLLLQKLQVYIRIKCHNSSIQNQRINNWKWNHFSVVTVSSWLVVSASSWEATVPWLAKLSGRASSEGRFTWFVKQASKPRTEEREVSKLFLRPWSMMRAALDSVSRSRRAGMCSAPLT